MDTLLNPKSAVQKGTLAYLRNVLNHRGAKKEVKNCFSHSIEFLYFVTEAYICLHAVEMLNLTDLKDRELREDPENALDRITKEILSRVWFEPDTTGITGSSIRKGYCLCEDGTNKLKTSIYILTVFSVATVSSSKNDTLAQKNTEYVQMCLAVHINSYFCF